MAFLMQCLQAVRAKKGDLDWSTVQTSNALVPVKEIKDVSQGSAWVRMHSSAPDDAVTENAVAMPSTVRRGTS